MGSRGSHFQHGRRLLLSGIAVGPPADVADRSGTSPRRFCTMFVICVRSELFVAIGAAAGSGEGKSAAAVTMAAKSCDRCQAASVTARLLRGGLWRGVFGGRPKPAAIQRAGRLWLLPSPPLRSAGVRVGGRNGGPHTGRGVAHFFGLDIEVSIEPRCQPRHAWRALSCLVADGRPERRGIGARQPGEVEREERGGHRR